jgi:hypothetical protein
MVVAALPRLRLLVFVRRTDSPFALVTSITNRWTNKDIVTLEV